MSSDDLTTENKERWLPVKLTNYELLDKARSMSNLYNERDALELQKSAAAKEFGEKIKNIEGEIAKLAQCVSSGFEHRSVTCEERLNFAIGEFRVTRLDTGEVLDARALTPNERQKKLNFQGTENEHELTQEADFPM